MRAAAASEAPGLPEQRTNWRACSSCSWAGRASVERAAAVRADCRTAATAAPLDGVRDGHGAARRPLHGVRKVQRTGIFCAPSDLRQRTERSPPSREAGAALSSGVAFLSSMAPVCFGRSAPPFAVPSKAFSLLHSVARAQLSVQSLRVLPRCPVSSAQYPVSRVEPQPAVQRPPAAPVSTCDIRRSANCCPQPSERLHPRPALQLP